MGDFINLASKKSQQQDSNQRKTIGIYNTRPKMRKVIYNNYYTSHVNAPVHRFP